MKVVNTFLDPIIHEAVEKKRLASARPKQADEDVESQTLLDELLNMTSGEPWRKLVYALR